MNKFTIRIAVALFCALVGKAGQAQVFPFPADSLLPANPTSADSLKLSLLDRTCGGAYKYKANSYNVNMVQNNISVSLGERLGGIQPAVCPPRTREEIDLGRLPPGNYTVTVVDFPGNPETQATQLVNFPFTVANPRPAKTAPYVRLDYSGTWWDPSNRGWGLFIWQDANRSTDTIFVALFTFTPDGKPAWYSFQPAWANTYTTADSPLLQSARPPGGASPPLGVNTNTAVGVASLDFTTSGEGDEGTLTYTFGTGAKQVRTIKRFKP